VGRVAVVLSVGLGVAALVLSQVSASRVWLHAIGGLHPWYHVGLFGALGLLAMMASPRPWVRVGWLLFAVAVGMSIEYGEVLRFNDDMEWFDIRYDAMGLLPGVVLGWLLARLGQRLDSRRA